MALEIALVLFILSAAVSISGNRMDANGGRGFPGSRESTFYQCAPQKSRF